ncbi:MAG: heavy metal-associated domain-containing protein [Flavobacteriaceae bacterium]|jgi:Cu+-exporting ATPase
MRFLYLSLLLLGVVACQNPKPAKIISVGTTEEQPATLAVAEEALKMNIEGMMCAIGCAATIEKNLSKTPGVVSANVDFEAQTAWVVFDAATTLNAAKLIAVVEKSGDGKTYTVPTHNPIAPSEIPTQN